MPIRRGFFCFCFLAAVSDPVRSFGMRRFLLSGGDWDIDVFHAGVGLKGERFGGGKDDEDLTYSLTQSLTYRPAKKRSSIHLG